MAKREVSDIELVKACAAVMGWPNDEIRMLNGRFYSCAKGGNVMVDPLHDDAQCFALIERFRLDIMDMRGAWSVRYSNDDNADWGMAEDSSLRRAVCLCVAASSPPQAE